MFGTSLDSKFGLAPMAGITDKAFRSFMRKMGCGVVVTELVSATGLRHTSQRTRRLMQFDPSQHPVGIQIFGDSFEDLEFAAKEVEQMGADFVDLNFGCPVAKVVKRGAGAAILRDPIRLRDTLRVVVKSVKIPVTIKVRTGWDHESRNSIEVAQMAADEGIHWMAIHGRTRAQAYSGKADWDYIATVKQNSKIPILGNGDITSGQMARDLLQKSGCDGVLIGRGCLKNPWIFQEAAGLTPEKDYRKLFFSLKEELESFFEDRLVGLQLKKLSAWYSHGYPGSSQFRQEIYQTVTKDQTFNHILAYFDRLNEYAQADTSDQDFLMGGHG